MEIESIENGTQVGAHRCAALDSLDDGRVTPEGRASEDRTAEDLPVEGWGPLRAGDRWISSTRV